MAKNEEEGFKRLIPTIVACVIVVLWAISFLVDIAVDTYEPHVSITPLALSASGFLFGSEFVAKRARNGHAKSNEEVKP